MNLAMRDDPNVEIKCQHCSALYTGILKDHRALIFPALYSVPKP